MKWLVVLLLFVIAPSACAIDPALESLRAKLIALRDKSEESPDTRGATAEYTTLKHQLRDWVESHLAHFDEHGDEGLLERKLNGELAEAGLTCADEPWQKGPQCPDESLRGYLSDIQISRKWGYLLVQTGIGIVCGLDESAYLYAWADDRWRLTWQSEQNDYTKDGYMPQHIVDVLISPGWNANASLILTTGHETWCTSNWHRVYYRLYRSGLAPTAKPILEGHEVAYLSADPPIRGSIRDNEMLVEYNVGSFDAGASSRPRVLHYRVIDNEMKRVAPFALSPRDFVEEWLGQTWEGTNGAAFWSENAHRREARDMHASLNKNRGYKEFIFPTTRCKAAPDLYQVGIDLSDPPVAIGAPLTKTAYILVRWRPPYFFSVVNAGASPRPDCSIDARAVDEELPYSLFPPR